MPALSRHRRWWLISTILVGCSAPGDQLPLSSPPEPGSTVVSREPAWTRSTRWTMTRSPLVEIGANRGNGPEDLLRVAGVVRLDDGRIVVGNGSTGELKYFDRDGKHVNIVGGIGFEPGSFRVMNWVQLTEGGEIVVYDESRRDLSAFDDEGNYVRKLAPSYDPQSYGGFVAYEGVFDDESVLVHQSRLTEDKGLQRSSDWFVRIPPIGLPATVTDAFPGTEMIRRHFVNMSDVSRPPFGRALHVAVAPDRFYVGDDDRYEISAFSPEGTLLHVVRLDGAERPITEAIIDRDMELRLPLNRDIPRRVLEPQMRAQITHHTLPAFSALLADPDGNLWARDFEVEMPRESKERWNVFDPNGRYLGALEMPKAFALMTVGTDYLAGVWKDKFGTERARIYGLKKPRRR